MSNVFATSFLKKNLKKHFLNNSFLVQVHLPWTRAGRRPRSDGRCDERDDQPVGRGARRADQRRRPVETSHVSREDGHQRNLEPSRNEGHPTGHRRGAQGKHLRSRLVEFLVVI